MSDTASEMESMTTWTNISTTTGSVYNPSYTVDEFVAYLHRVGYHDIAERVSGDRQIIVLYPDRPERES